MEKKYYSEEIEKNTRYREEYLSGINAFLRQEKGAAEERRRAFANPENYKKAQAEYRESFIKMLGFPLTVKAETPTLLEKTFVARDGKVNIYRMQFLFWGCVKTYGLYFEQYDKRAETPFVLGLHGGEGTPELVSSMHLNSANYNHLVRRLTDGGANVFAPQLLLWSKENYGGEYNRAEIDGKLRQLGGSITALELYFLRGAIDYFTQNELINADKIGVCGLSYGGMYALHLAAVDTRIKGCYSCSWVCDGFENSWADWSYKNAQNTFAVAETAGLIAPRALAIGMGDKDNLFDYRLTQTECARIQEFYREFQAENRLKCRIFAGEHEFDKSADCLAFLLAELSR